MNPALLHTSFESLKTLTKPLSASGSVSIKWKDDNNSPYKVVKIK